MRNAQLTVGLCGTLLAAALLGWSSAVTAQFTQCSSYYNTVEGKCKRCSGDSQGVGKRSWRDFGSYCISCELNCLLWTKTSDAAMPPESACQPEVVDGSDDAAFIALDPRDNGIDALARHDLASAHILTAMLASSDGIAPIDWSSGQVPFSSVPTRSAFELLRRGQVPGPSELQPLEGRFSATYVAEKTPNGYRLSIQFFGDGAAAPNSTVRNVVLTLEQGAGETFADLREQVVVVALHRLVDVKIDGEPVDLTVVGPRDDSFL